MKKALFISIFFLLFLSGCYFLGDKNISSKQKNGLDIIYTKQNQFDSLADDVIFSQQEIKRSIMESTETGRASIHNFPTLGIKVYSDDPYSESFKTEFPFIIKNGNMLIDKFSPIQYIEVIAKDPSEDIGDIFKQKYFKQYVTGCKISIETGNSYYFTGKFSDNIILYTVSPGSLDHECHIGKVPYEKYVQVWYNSKKPDRYYIVNLGVGCAPGKCNVFNQIELY